MLWTVKELAHWLQVKPSTLYAWAVAGKIPCLKIHGLLRFRPDEIARWLEAFQRPLAMRRRTLITRSHDELDALVARAKRQAYSPRLGDQTDAASKGG